VDGDPELEQFEPFFDRTFPALVGQAYLLTGDLQEAQDLAQEALTRAWDRWPLLSAYDDPGAWTRRVLHNLAVSRLRRRGVERRHERTVRATTPGPSAEAVDLVRALERLPVAQRRALVLHEVLALTTEEVAREMNASPGTVRKWLHRARTALVAALDDAEPPVGIGNTTKKEVRDVGV
jgi:RNA polymerase sigma-70 factor (ECF subfamily)